MYFNKPFLPLMPYTEDVLNMFLLNKIFFIHSEVWYFRIFRLRLSLVLNTPGT